MSGEIVPLLAANQAPAPSPPPVFTDSRIGTTPDIVLSALRQQAATACGLSLYRTRLVQDRDQVNNFPPNSLFVYIVPGKIATDRGQLAGGGKNNNSVEQEVEVVISGVCYLDPADRAAQWLLNNAAGVIPRANALMAVLQSWDPVDGDGNKLLNQPAIVAGGLTECKSGKFGAMSLDLLLRYTWSCQSPC